MTDKKRNALELADALEKYADVDFDNDFVRAAAELRRVYNDADSLCAALNNASMELAKVRAENEALRGLKPEIPQRAPHNNDASYQHPALPRYGLRWNGPGLPVSVPMDDGYWTPFHLALAAIDAAMKGTQ